MAAGDTKRKSNTPIKLVDKGEPCTQKHDRECISGMPEYYKECQPTFVWRRYKCEVYVCRVTDEIDC